MSSLTTRFLAITVVAVVAGALVAPGLQAQQVYRIVGSDGKVTFSDQPPPAATNAKVTGAKGGAVSASALTSLPFELRQVATQYPVTLYTGDNCSPCGAARSLLTTRGIPFTEKTVTSAQDSEALVRISGENSLPFLTIGGQQLKGYADAEWTQYLDAAGYPKTSVLPTSYHNTAASPLVVLQKQAPAVKPEETQQAPTMPSSPPVDSTSNPAGIKF